MTRLPSVQLTGFVRQNGVIMGLTFQDADKPVNVLNNKTLAEFSAHVDMLEREIAAGNQRILGVVIRSSKQGSFIAGADIEELSTLRSQKDAEQFVRGVHDLFNRLEALPVPVLALINGVCLGGGLELAMACHYRIASQDAKHIGLPETQLGIIPGFGGTQRLPRLIGIEPALKAITTGRRYTAQQAKALGLVDEVVADDQLLKEAFRVIDAVVLGDTKLTKTSERSAARSFVTKMPFARGLVRKAAQREAHKTTRGHYPAIPAAIDAVMQSTGPLEKGLLFEAKAIAQLAESDVARYLMALFFLRERTKKQGGGKTKRVNTLGVIGAGVMGRTIAFAALKSGLNVLMTDTSTQALLEAQAFIRDEMVKRFERGQGDIQDLGELEHRLTTTTDLGIHRHADVVIEAIVEDLTVKQKVLGSVRRSNPNGVIATNTSSLSVADIGGGVLGMHFFNPAHKMPLVEIVTTEEVHPDDVATLVRLAERMQKTPVVVADYPGFLVNRVLGVYFAEAVHLAQQGVGIEAIDSAMTHFGMPMGPFRLLDEIGFDIAAHVAENLVDAYGARMAVGVDLQGLVADGISGKKSGTGFWFSEDGEPSDTVASRLGLSMKSRVSMAQDEIQHRLAFVLAFELGRCLEEEVVTDAGIADLAMILGTGFPPFRGGPLAYMDAALPSYGIAWLLPEDEDGQRFEPCQWMLDTVERNTWLRPDVAKK